ncbi:MAG: hydrolase [Oscillospiraceae bacterium]|jgi:ADP-ribose pyrophosphatase|nr:hydrolase [Oscillospiraceae bacterium]
MELFEKRLATQNIYEGRIIALKKDTVLLENNVEATREVVMHPGGVCIVPLDENDEVLLVKQFRYPYGKAIYEIPAGKLNRGEDPFECGKRELLEETGATASEYVFLGELYPSPAYVDEVIYMYLAKGLAFSSQNLDEDEFLQVCRFPLQDVVDKILNGEIKDSKTQTAILKTKMLKLQGKI